MSTKLTREHYSDLAKERNHVLQDVSNPDAPSQGTLLLKCNTCGKEFYTTAKSYKNARKTGCPHCKSIKARAQSSTKKRTNEVATDTMTPAINSAVTLDQQQQLVRVQAKTSARLEQRAKFQRDNQVYSRKELLSYLRINSNEYTKFMLDKIDGEADLLADSKQTKQVHHIIPTHAGGPNAKWNLVTLTPEDHCKAHELRYSVYQEFGDYNFLQTQGQEVRSRIQSNPKFDAQLLAQRQNANQNARPTFVGDAGNQASQAVLAGLTPEAQKAYRERHQNQMSEPVRKVLQEGGTFYHKQTKTTFVLQPQKAPTLTELKNLLAKALPQGHVDRIRLETTPKPVNVTAALGKMIKGVKDRPSAYGWSLQK